MARKVLIVLLSLGAIAGFAGGFAQMHHFRHHGPGHGPWGSGHGFGHADYEDRIADVCARAAERALRDGPGHREPPPPEHRQPPRPEPPPSGS